MTLEDYAALEMATGTRLQKSGGVFWRSVRPCFYRPVFPFQRIAPTECKPPFPHHLGCAQYAVSDPAQANSAISTLVYDKLGTYGLDTISANLRKKIRKAQNHFHVERIEDREQLTRQGFPVYQSFLHRTNYAYNRQRREEARFREWAETLLSFSGVRILGAFSQERLHAIGISYLIGEVLCYATFIAETGSLAQHVSDLMLHTIREHAAHEDGARLLFTRYSTGERGLDEYYLQRGAQIHRIPARIEGNVIALAALKRWSPRRYRQLYGLKKPDSEPESPAIADDRQQTNAETHHHPPSTNPKCLV